MPSTAPDERTPLAPVHPEDGLTALLTPGTPALIWFSEAVINPQNGRWIRGGYGPVTILRTRDILGFEPKNPSTNWFAQIGYGETGFLVAGCRIHYASQQSAWRECWAGEVGRFDGASQ